MKQTTERIVQKINSLKDQVPNDWAEQISKQIGKSPTLVRYYARGERGENKGYPLIVLQHLIIIHEEHMNQVEKFTA